MRASRAENVTGQCEVSAVTTDLTSQGPRGHTPTPVRLHGVQSEISRPPAYRHSLLEQKRRAPELLVHNRLEAIGPEAILLVRPSGPTVDQAFFQDFQ
jgi:hypothetical protein